MPEFAWKCWGKPGKVLDRISGFRADIWTRSLPNEKGDDNHSQATFGDMMINKYKDLERTRIDEIVV
jgi:hypothetical protein